MGKLTTPRVRSGWARRPRWTGRCEAVDAKLLTSGRTEESIIEGTKKH